RGEGHGYSGRPTLPSTEPSRRPAARLGAESGVKQGGCMSNHAVIIAGAGPTGLMLAGELALSGIDVAIVERRPTQELVGARAGGLHARSIEVLDQRGIADRFLAAGKVAQVAGYAFVRLDI